MVGMVPLALAAMVSGASLPQAVPPIPVIAAEQPPLPDTGLGFSDIEHRMAVRVSIDGRGPYEFVVDTGAQRTVVSQDLAGLLALRAGPDVHVTAITNAATVGSVVVPSLRVNAISASGITAPALDQANMGAPGMLGLDALQGHKISIDFDRDRITVMPSRPNHQVIGGPNDIVVTAKSRFGQLIVTDAYLEGKRIAVVIDTGTPVTIANRALLKLIDKSPRSLGRIHMLSALGRWLDADYVAVNDFKVGTATFHDVPMAVADAEPFKRFGLTEQPALLMGMDLLRLFRRVDIDFANRQILFSLPTPTLMAGTWSVRP